MDIKGKMDSALVIKDMDQKWRKEKDMKRHNTTEPS